MIDEFAGALRRDGIRVSFPKREPKPMSSPAPESESGVTTSTLEKIISGGQTGVDRGALDAALEASFPCGGWCPKGRKAEDGPIPARYPLKEMDGPAYRLRTERNVRDSDGTLILFFG
jgi:hypothetical protein